MAEATIGGSILSKIREEAYKSDEANTHHETLSEKLSGMLMGTDDMKTAFVEAAEEEASAILAKDKSTKVKEEREKESEEKAQAIRIKQMNNFQQLGSVLKSNAAKLGSALQDDFKQLTAGFSMLASTPGMRSIIALVTAIGTTLGSLLLISIKNSGILGKTVSEMIAQDEDGNLDLGKTMKNVKDKFNPFSGGGKEKKTKKDGSKDMRFAENQSILVKMNKQIDKNFKAMSKGMKTIGDGLKNPIKTLKKGWTALKNGTMAMAKGFFSGAKKLMMAAVRLIASILVFSATMMVAVISFLAFPLLILAGIALVGLAIYGLYMGFMWLKDNFGMIIDKLKAGWEVIKEGFAIALDGLGIWKDTAVQFISNTFKSIWLSIKSLFSSVLTGLENGINYAIQGINKLIPGTKWDLDPVDIGAGKMAESVKEDKAAFEIEKAGQAEEMAQRQTDLDDRKANNTMERATNIVNQSNVQNDAPSSTMITPDGTSPGDQFAGNMALAQ